MTIATRSSRLLARVVVVIAASLALLGPGTSATAQPASDPAANVGTIPIPGIPDGGVIPGPAGPSGSDDVVVPDVPDVTVSVDSDDDALSRTVVIVLLLTIGSVAPALLLLMTTFTRFIVVLGLTKNALGAHTVPPSQVLIGLALFLTFFAMSPVLSEVNQQAVEPFLDGRIGQQQALEQGFTPMREFMLAQTRERDLQLFTDLAGAGKPATSADIAATTLIPAFVISELRTAFLIGFIIFVPFLVIDLVVAAVLMAMGMMMLPPIFVSLPLKLLLFVLVDGWVLVVGSLVSSVNGVAV